jgi:hypothetical protein
LRKNHWENEFNVKNEAKNEGNKMKVLNKKAKVTVYEKKLYDWVCKTK